ncbi:hypothetical protein [Salipiger bermudensis]|uniref:hypothetical protein n=1 Tax=Salipiger bermudensis TaxID=344736 RepID=UPI001CD5BB24|nr:hypothetical protein [Salipiger bermudensis]MCA0961136.1 hypothetical protein [Salipiger bermudensis]
MAHYVILNGAGCVQQIHNIDLGIEGAIEIADDQVSVVQDSYYSEGWFLPRPRIELPELDGNNLAIPPLPLGTRVTIVDQLGEAVLRMVTETEDWSDTLAFEDAGRYSIDVAPPAPYLPSSAVAEVPE